MVGCNSNTNNHLASIASLPMFKIRSIDSSIYIFTSNISSGKPSVFIYFSPDCEHCIQETQAISRSISDLKSANIFMITSDTSVATCQFYKSMRLDTIPNIFVGNDDNYSFYKAFLPSTTPYIVIYNKNKELRKIYKGFAPVSSIITTINE